MFTFHEALVRKGNNSLCVPPRGRASTITLHTKKRLRLLEIMTAYFCDQFLSYQLSPSEAEHLHLSYNVSCVFGAFLSYTATVLNIITIHAVRKTSSLPKPLKALLLSLAVSDLSVGLLCIPFGISMIAKWLQQDNPSCTTYVAFFVTLSLFCFASLFGVMVLSIDRFVAIHLHLRYQELVTYNRVVAVVISLWIFSAFLSLIIVWIPAKNTTIFSLIGILCLVTTTYLNYKIYLAVRRHRNQIQTLQVQQETHNGEMANAASIRKSALGTFYVYLVRLLCFVPRICISIAIAVSEHNTTIKGFSVYTFLLMFLNSSLNPVIYCWKMRNIRHAIMDMLRNICVRRS